MAEETAGEQQGTQDTGTDTEGGTGQQGEETSPPSLMDRLASKFGGRPVRSAQVRHEEEAAARDAAAQPDPGDTDDDGDEDGDDDPGGEEGTGEEGQQDKPKRGRRRKTSVKMRELRGEITERDLKIARMEGELDALRKARGSGEEGAQPDGAGDAGGEPGKGAEAVSDPEPQEEEFDTLADYYKELGRWGARQELRAKELEAQLKQEVLTKEAYNAKKQKEFEDFVTKGRKAFEDFDSVALPDNILYSQAMYDTVVGSELGAELAYYLGRNPKEAARIAHLEPLGSVKALAKIEADIESGRIAIPEKSQDDAAPVGETHADETAGAAGSGDQAGAAGAGAQGAGDTSTTQAPSRTHAAPPLKPVKGGERPEPDMAELAKKNPAEYMRIRNEKERRSSQNQ